MRYLDITETLRPPSQMTHEIQLVRGYVLSKSATAGRVDPGYQINVDRLKAYGNSQYDVMGNKQDASRKSSPEKFSDRAL